MTLKFVAASFMALLIGISAAAPANAWKRGSVETVAVVPGNAIEGLTVGPDGYIYVPTFGFNANGAVSGPARLYVFTDTGKLIQNVAIANSSPHILGLGFNPVTHDLLVLDFGAGNVLKVDSKTGASSVFMVPTAAGSGLSLS